MGLAGWELLAGAQLAGASVPRALKPPTPSSPCSSNSSSLLFNDVLSSLSGSLTGAVRTWHPPVQNSCPLPV